MEFHDARIGPVGDLDGVDAVALTVQTFTARSAYALAASLRNPVRFANYVAYNPLFRREVFTKQSMALGYHATTTPPQAT